MEHFLIIVLLLLLLLLCFCVCHVHALKEEWSYEVDRIMWSSKVVTNLYMRSPLYLHVNCAKDPPTVFTMLGLWFTAIISIWFGKFSKNVVNSHMNHISLIKSKLYNMGPTWRESCPPIHSFLHASISAPNFHVIWSKLDH